MTVARPVLGSVVCPSPPVSHSFCQPNSKSMSLANSTRRATTVPPGRSLTVKRCEQCQAHYPHSGQHKYGFNRRFCSWQCKYRSLADSLLEIIQFDHRYCYGCFRLLKTISEPTLSRKSAKRGKSIPSCATGRQQYEDHARMDMQNTNRRSDPVHEYGSTTLESRMTCGACPSNHHTTAPEPRRDHEMTKERLIDHTQRLVAALDELDERGKHRTDYDTDALYSYVRAEKSRPSEQGRDDRSILRDGLAYAIREA